MKYLYGDAAEPISASHRVCRFKYTPGCPIVQRKRLEIASYFEERITIDDVRLKIEGREGTWRGVAFLEAPLGYTFSTKGTLLWLAIVLVFASLASILPAWNASRLSVREVLAYE